MGNYFCDEIRMDEWGESLVAPLNNARYPLSGSIDLTERCNLNCVHCYINQPVTCKACREKELSTDQVKSILEKITEAGCLFLVLTGGEPLLRPDFSEIYIHAKRLGLLVTLFTNATLLTPKIADLLAAYRPHMVEITMYGATEKTYEAVTRVPGSFKRFMHGLDLLRERKIRFALKSIVVTLNKHELPEMRAIAESFGTEFRYDGSIYPRLDGDQTPFLYRLSVDDMLEMDQEYPKRAEEWLVKAAEFKGQLIRSEYVYNCGAGLRNFHINHEGKLSICTMVRTPLNNLKSMDFYEAWNNLGELRRKKRQLHTICETCTVGALCGQCPAWSLLVHGDDETPVEFVCQLGKMRARKFSSEIVTNYEEIQYEQENI